jgi:hypothetical protein
MRRRVPSRQPRVRELGALVETREVANVLPRR